MKKLLFSCAFALSSVMMFAQLDLAVTEILSPTAGSDVKNGEPIVMEFVISNEGTTTLNPTDTIFYQVTLNGNTVTFSNSSGQFNTIPMLVNKTMAPSDTVKTYFSATFNFEDYTGPISMGGHVRGTTFPLQSDNDISNDTLTTIINVVSSGGVSIDEFTTSADVSIVKGYYSNNTLHINGYNISSNLNVDIYNLSGQKMSNHILSAGNKVEGTVDTKNLNSGVYIYHITDQNGKVYKSDKFFQQ